MILLSIYDPVHHRASGSDNYCYGAVMNGTDDIIHQVKFHLHCWTRYDSRIMMVNELKKLLGFQSVELIRHQTYIVSKYQYGDVTLDHVQYHNISNRLKNKIRATFALRYILGMRANTERSIVIRNHQPLSLDDKFPSIHIYGARYRATISRDVQNRWFDYDDIDKAVRYFPVWMDELPIVKIRIFESLAHTIMKIMTKWGCGYLYNYLIDNLRQGLND